MVKPDLPALRKEAKRTFGLSYLDEFTLYGAWRVVERKVVPVLGIGNWRTTLAGIVVAIATYLQQNGAEFPTDRKGLQALAVGACIIWWAAVQKDRAVGSQPGDPMTPARVVGALEAGEKVSKVEVQKSADATVTVASEATPLRTGI